jgi:predicted AAA+ superfamily ATPase
VPTFVDRHLAVTATEMLEHSPGIVLEGARQVGKSTLARRLAPDALVLNFDEEQTRAAATHDLPGLIDRAGGRPIIIDEIQRLPESTLPIKVAIDGDRRPGRFILTGSASYLRVRGLADSLAGRVIRLPLYPLSQGELRQGPDDFTSGITRSEQSVLTDFATELGRDDYITAIASGGYPEASAAAPGFRRRWIDSYVDNLLRRDLTEMRRDVDPARAAAILRALAGSQASELVKARLAERTSVPPVTITGYLDLLADAGLIHAVAPWTPNLAKREVGRSKCIVVDSALALRMARLSEDQLGQIEYGEALGAFLEAFVVGEVLRQRSWTATEFDLFHYRDRAGVEVDLVLELSGGRVIAIEVKAASSFRSAQFTGLRKLRDQLGDRFLAGVVLNTGRHGFRLDDRLYGLPVAALWEL